MPISPTLPPGTPQSVKTAFQRLFEHATAMEQVVQQLQGKVGAMPAPLTLSQIQAALQADGSHPLNIQNLQGTPATSNPTIPSSGGGGGGGGGGGYAPAPNHADIAQAVYTELGISGTSTPFQLFKATQTVIWRIAQIQAPTDPQVGFVTQAGGDGTYNCGGTLFAIYRLMYNNGANIHIWLSPEKGNAPGWYQEANVNVSDWHAPTDPATVCP